MGHSCCQGHHHTHPKESIACTVLVEAKSEALSPKAGDKAIVHYTGRLINADGSEGKEFDSSKKRGKPFEFVVGKGYVIAGWDIAVAQMKEGETRKVRIPASLAYGAAGIPGVIPQNATLSFEIELLQVVKKN